MSFERPQNTTDRQNFNLPNRQTENPWTRDPNHTRHYNCYTKERQDLHTKSRYKYSQKDFSPLRARLPYYAPIINGVEIFDAGKFEWENVIKPFWKANKNKSEDEFADEWQKVMDEQTFTMRDKIYDFFNNEFSSSPVDASIVFGDKKQLMDLSYLENNKTDKQKQMLKEEKKYATSSL